MKKGADYELGRYKKKVEDQQKEIQQLKEAIEGYENSQSGVFAMITAVVQQVGEVTITREAINEIIRTGVQTQVRYDHEAGAYTLRVAGGESDGEEGAAETGKNR